MIADAEFLLPDRDQVPKTAGRIGVRRWCSGTRLAVKSGDGVWFEGDRGQAHRCRNLSRHDTALSLHVYGGALAEYFAYEQAAPSGRWVAQPRRSVIAGRLPG